MFCYECGKPVEGEQLMCPECAAKMAPKQDLFELNQPDKKPQKKRKRKLPWILSAVAVVLILSFVAVWGFMISGAFLPADAYMQKVEKKAITSMTGDLGEIYGKFMSAEPSQNKVQNGAEVETHVQFGDEMIDMLEAYLFNSSDGEMDLSFLKDISIKGNMAMDGNKTQMVYDLGLNNKTVLTMSMLMNMKDMEIFMGIPSLSEQFIKIDMEELTGNTGTAMPSTPAVDYEQMGEMIQKMQQMLPDEETFTALLEKYLLLAIEQIENIDKQTEKVSVGDVEQKLTVVTVKLSEKDVLKIAKAVLKEAKSDSELKRVIKNIGKNGEELGIIPNGEDLYNQFKAAVDSALEELEGNLEDASTKKVLVIETYVNNKMEIVGRTIKNKAMDDFELSYITVWKGKNFAFEAKLPSGIEISGEGTEKKNVLNAEYELSVNGKDYLSVELQDYDKKKAEEGYPSFTLRIEPAEDLLDSIPSGGGNDVAGALMNLLGDDLALEIKFSTTKTKAEMGFKVLAGKKMLFGITSSVKQTEGTVTEPDNYITVDSDRDLEKWLESLDLEALMTKLENAGVPRELLEAFANGGQSGSPGLDYDAGWY